MHEALCKGCINKLQSEICTFSYWDIWGWATGRAQTPKSLYSIPCLPGPPSRYGSISSPGWLWRRKEAPSWAPKVSSTRAQRWETNEQLYHTPGLTAKLITAGFHKAWLNRALVQWGCTPVQLSHLSGSGTADAMDSHLGRHLGEPAHQRLPVEPPRRPPNLCGWRKPSNRNI